WERAEKLFLSLERLDPHSLVYSLYRKRTLSFRESTPPPDWDGTFTYTEK
ncbi:MAG: hypothetical protein JRH19_19780, partial [Deltaproteobacteria bacterium]|nr:hypothetical protein [Deltaproteobacteria bacterium]